MSKDRVYIYLNTKASARVLQNVFDKNVFEGASPTSVFIYNPENPEENEIFEGDEIYAGIELLEKLVDHEDQITFVG